MSGPAIDQDVLDFAVEVAEAAGRLAADRFYALDFTISLKPDGTEVTEVDLAIENFIRSQIQRRYPDDEIYGEEAGTTAGRSGRRWIIDPINGTTYFAHRMPIFSMNIAYEDEHGPAVGVINYPVNRQILYAGRGRGCRIRSGDTDLSPILRDNAELAKARVELVNFDLWPPDIVMTLHRHVRAMGYLGGVGGMLTGVLDAIVIAGNEMGYEDLAPLPIIVEEAGGRATDLDGGPLLSGPGTALLSTGWCHDDLLDLLRLPAAN
ncbi:inositol monophosphatase family protein [Planosporangium sp. 12N6]|uniref:inositol monophosphatase family protein n=1 Tax=Planosporangium spinosum TaxID=3402278 RepID=UPI003CE83AE3